MDQGSDEVSTSNSDGVSASDTSGQDTRMSDSHASSAALSRMSLSTLSEGASDPDDSETDVPKCYLISLCQKAMSPTLV